MTDHLKYLVTVDAKTGATVKIEELGESGELTDVTPPPSAPHPAGGSVPGYAVHIHIHPPAAPGFQMTPPTHAGETPGWIGTSPQAWPGSPVGWPGSPQAWPGHPPGWIGSEHPHAEGEDDSDDDREKDKD